MASRHVGLMVLAGCVAAAVAAQSPARGGGGVQCVVVHDLASQQRVRLEAHGAHAIRARAVPPGLDFRDDLVSALVDGGGRRDGRQARCPEVALHGARGPTDPPPAITNGNLRAAVGADGRLTYTRVSDGVTLLQEKVVRRIEPTVTSPPVPGFYSLDLEFAAVDGERIYGLGQHAKLPWDGNFPADGILNMKGVQGLLLAPHDGEVLIPVVHSSLGYVFLFNLPSLGTVEYNSTTSAWHAEAVVQMDVWVGTTADSGAQHVSSPWGQLQQSYVDATGHSPVYPEWASGFWQCKLRYSNQSQILDVVHGYLDRGVNLSLIVIDFYSWNDPDGGQASNTLGDETLPKTCWPDPKGMVDELKALGVELMVSPYSHSVAKTSTKYAAAETRGLLATDADGNAALGYAGGYVYDLFTQQARDYAWGNMQAGYVEQYGLHHWWLDCNEPCGGTNNGSFANNWLYNNGTWPAAFVGAAYPAMVDRMIYDGEGAPGKMYTKDNVMLSRSAWAGSQRYGAAVWSGDTQSTWDDFNQQFRAGLNMMMSGTTYWTTDIGGFANGDTTDPNFRELVVRWFQWGAFCPLFRLHGIRKGPVWPPGPGGKCGQTASNEIWSFGNESEAAIIKVMQLRDSLRPYVMEQYTAASASGTPVSRPLFYDFWDDSGAQAIEDEMMFGPDYLVAPVLARGVPSRKVYLPRLPSGMVWTNVFTGVTHDTSGGGITITEVTPNSGPGFATFPLYKRSTSVVQQ